jgi:hypothetical protein
VLAGRLRRAATFLRKIGIEIGFEREGRARTRIIRLSTAEPSSPEAGGARPSASSAPPAHPPRTNLLNGFGSGNVRTVGDQADGSQASQSPIVHDNPLKSNGEADADGADANRPPRTEPEKAGTPAWRARL